METAAVQRRVRHPCKNIVVTELVADLEVQVRRQPSPAPALSTLEIPMSIPASFPHIEGGSFLNQFRQNRQLDDAQLEG